MSFYFHPSNQQFANVSKLKPTTGYCIFVDMFDSTNLKNEPFPVWACIMQNTFAEIRCFFKRDIEPLKLIGDCCMFFINETELNPENNENALSLFSALCDLAGNPDQISHDGIKIDRDVKVAISFCVEAFDISFEIGKRDIYGKEIDFTKRLEESAIRGEVVMNKGFRDRVLATYDLMPPSVTELEPRVKEILLSLPDAIPGHEIYKVKAPHLKQIPVQAWKLGPVVKGS